MIKIDFHVHITPPEIINNIEKYTSKEPYFAMLSQSPKNKFATAPDVIKELEHSHFDRAVVFGFGFKDAGLCRLVNDYVIDMQKKYPDKLIGFISMPPGKNSVQEIERCVLSGLKGVGELFPQGQNLHIDDNKKTMRWAGTCKELNLPVLIHANEPVGHYYPGKTKTTLRQIEQFINNNPNQIIVLAHWGGLFLFYEMMNELKEKCKNVFYDCAASPFLYNSDIYKACSLGFAKKIVFGSDYPLIPIKRYLEDIEKSGISDKEKELLLGENAKNILQI